jgi:hypothetical protein
MVHLQLCQTDGVTSQSILPAISATKKSLNFYSIIACKNLISLTLICWLRRKRGLIDIQSLGQKHSKAKKMILGFFLIGQSCINLKILFFQVAILQLNCFSGPATFLTLNVLPLRRSSWTQQRIQKQEMC